MNLHRCLEFCASHDFGHNPYDYIDDVGNKMIMVNVMFGQCLRLVRDSDLNFDYNIDNEKW